MNSYVLPLQNSEDLLQEFKKIGVDSGGIKIMRTKSFLRPIKIYRLASYCANILKQEMLSLGGDVALGRGALTGKDKTTDCLVLGNLSQLLRLAEKLKKQPFGLFQIGQDIKSVLDNFERKNILLGIGDRTVRFGQRTMVMGIINTTPDSFSGDGIFGMEAEEAFIFAKDMIKNGADILDIGGESSRPGAHRISVKEERCRVMPLLSRLAKKTDIPLSIDTTKSEVAHAALDSGATIVNDISALRFDKKMAKLVARYKATVVLMHMKGLPQTMQRNPQYEDVIGEILTFLNEAILRAEDAGINREKIIVDPGIGFGKTLENNFEILNKLSAFKSLGRPVLVGFSRKSMIGKVLKLDVHERKWGTAACLSLAISHGADMVRVHDVREMKQVTKMLDAILR